VALASPTSKFLMALARATTPRGDEQKAQEKDPCRCSEVAAVDGDQEDANAEASKSVGSTR